MFIEKDVLKIPEGVKVSVSGSTISVEGPKGKVEKTLPPIEFFEEDEKICIKTERKEMINTAKSHLRNMVVGVTDGFHAKMKVLYSHFPISVEVKPPFVLIKNFLGERTSRKARILGDSKVQVKGQEVIVSGTDKEAVYQTAQNIREATRIRRFDSRIFQDGIYVVEKSSGGL